MADLSQAELEEMVQGKPIDPFVTFEEKAVINVAKSREAHRRVYDTKLMITNRYPGVTDYIPRQATKADIRKYPNEYSKFMADKNVNLSPSVSIIPGISLAEAQELRDIGMGTVKQLAESKEVPHHLSHLLVSAKMLYGTLKSMEPNNSEHGNDQKVSQEKRIQAQPTTEVAGRHKHDHVEQRRPAAGDEIRAGERHEAARPKHDHPRESKKTALRQPASFSDFDLEVMIE